MVILRNRSVCLTVLLWFCHHPLNMPDEKNQRQQTHSLRGGHFLGSSTDSKIKLTIVLGKTLIRMTSDLETNTENAHTKLQTQEPRTNATVDFLLHVWAHSEPDYAELLFWKHEGDMVTIVMVSRQCFPGRRRGKE